MSKTKLKNLRIRKVDFVDEGANPRANILVRKKKEEESGEDELDTLAKRLAEKLLCVFHRSESIEKGNETTFSEKMSEVKRQKVCGEIWDICYALQSSLTSIICSDEVDGTQAERMMKESLQDFEGVMEESIGKWSSGEAVEIEKSIDFPMAEEIPALERARDTMNKMIEKAKGEEEMKIDKAKMSPAERLAYESLVEKYKVDDEPSTDDETSEKEEKRKKCAKSAAESGEITHEEPQDTHMGLDPVVAAELESLKKFREAAEEKELQEVAKKYTVIGKKPEELVPMLKNLKVAGGSAYNDMIALMDAAVDTVEKSALFGEIGKSGYTAGDSETESIAKARAKAEEIRKNRPELTKEQALDLVFQEDDRLRAEFDK